MFSLRNKEHYLCIILNTPSYLELCYISINFLKAIYCVNFFALLFYVHGKHLRSCRDGQLT